MSKDGLRTLRGYSSAVPTPLRNGAVDENAFAEFCQWQIEQGISALVVNGTTGEAPTLTMQEQRRLIRIAVEVAHSNVPVIAGAGSNATAHAIEIARQAEAAGACGLLVVTPYYNKPSQEGLVRHFRAVHDATDLPILLYDVPSRTGCSIVFDTLCRLAQLPRIIGLKDATGDLSRPGTIRRLLGNRLVLFSGDDATALDFMGLGGSGCISVVSNVAPKLCNRLHLACACGEQTEARVIEKRLKPLAAALFLESNPIPVKWALGLMGRMAPEVRLPLCEPAEPTRTAVRKALTLLGLLGPNLLVQRVARVLSYSN